MPQYNFSFMNQAYSILDARKTFQSARDFSHFVKTRVIKQMIDRKFTFHNILRPKLN
jgi:hypothetical protein